MWSPYNILPYSLLTTSKVKARKASVPITQRGEIARGAGYIWPKSKCTRFMIWGLRFRGSAEKLFGLYTQEVYKLSGMPLSSDSSDTVTWKSFEDRP